MKRALSIIAAAWMGSQLLACSVGDPDGGYSANMTFEEFEAVTYQEPWEGGAYIVNGDTPIADRKHLYEFWKELFHPEEGALIVNTIGGTDDRWSDTQKLNITYCVSSSSFGSRYSTVVTAMEAAAAGWGARANVKIIHVSSADSACSTSTAGVVFNVRQVSGQSYLARSFFPSSSRTQREVLIDSSSFTQTTWPLANILGHELGHTLGFRHEHTRPESGTCFEDNNWRALTAYDRASIMHYPQCNGIANGTLQFTTLDGQGAAALYGAPGSPPPPPPTGVARTQTWSGSLVQNRTTIVQLSPTLSVVAGSTLTVNMTGTGDADLYVRFGGAPTLSVYNCRPFTSSANESCNLTVPAGTTTANVGVVGYTASTYNITANYLAPQ